MLSAKPSYMQTEKPHKAPNRAEEKRGGGGGGWEKYFSRFKYM